MLETIPREEGISTQSQKTADRYGLYIKDFCNVCLPLVPYSASICVFPRSKYNIYLL